MSLDVYLTMPRDEQLPVEKACALLRQHDLDEFANELECRHEHGPREVYWRNITHNLGKMADAAGIYEHLWHPDRVSITKAKQLIEPLTAGLERLRADPVKFSAFNAPNGWGLYEHFVPFVSAYLDACREHPEADVRTST